MRIPVAASTFLFAIFLLSGLARAVDAPIILSHEVAGYERGAGSVTINYTLHIVNPGEGSLSNLTLTVVPSQLVAKGVKTIDVGLLPAKQSVDLFFQLEGTAALPKEALLREPILFSGRGLDGGGNVVEFPVKSYSGGAQ